MVLNFFFSIVTTVNSDDDKTVANRFNQFFTSIGEITNEKIKLLANECGYVPLQPTFSHEFPPAEQFTFTRVHCQDIEKTVSSLATNKAPGIDKLPARVIKDSAPVIIHSITSIINTSLITSTFPEDWKIADVSPILKEGDFEEAGNNRPISLLPILSKVCEKAALNQLMPYLTANKRLAVNQSGNKKWHSTETSLVASTDTILEAIDKRKLTAVVYLDMSKAFDSINHGILLRKLKAIGLAPSAISWFNSYLSQRSQVVRINAELSDALPVMCRVPQGSVLGALLFSIYVNDLPAVSEVCSTACYVDDTKLILSFTVDECYATEDKINADLQRIRDWCFENYLLLNPDKTKLMVFGSQQMICKLPSFKLSFLGKELLPTDSVKDLGVIFDPTLSFDSHITALAATCISRLAQINRAKHAFNSNLLVNIINALVFSRLFYCSTVWSNTSDKNLRKLQHVQNFAARIISGERKFDHITPVLRELRWLTVKQQLYLRDAVFTFKCMTGCAPDYLRSKLVTRGQASGRMTRNSQQLNIPLFRTATGQRSFQYRAVSLWNSLDKDLKLSKNHEVFKRKLKHILRDS